MSDNIYLSRAVTAQQAKATQDLCEGLGVTFKISSSRPYPCLSTARAPKHHRRNEFARAAAEGDLGCKSARHLHTADDCPELRGDDFHVCPRQWRGPCGCLGWCWWGSDGAVLEPVFQIYRSVALRWQELSLENQVRLLAVVDSKTAGNIWYHSCSLLGSFS